MDATFIEIAKINRPRNYEYLQYLTNTYIFFYILGIFYILFRRSATVTLVCDQSVDKGLNVTGEFPAGSGKHVCIQVDFLYIEIVLLSVMNML